MWPQANLASQKTVTVEYTPMYMITSQSVFTCTKLTIKRLEQSIFSREMKMVINWPEVSDIFSGCRKRPVAWNGWIKAKGLEGAENRIFV